MRAHLPKSARVALEDEDVLGLFQGIIGGEGPLDLAVVYPKYCAIRAHVARFARLLEILRDLLPAEAFGAEAAALAAYAAAFRARAAEIFAAPELAELYPPTLEDRAFDRAADFAAVGPEARAAFEAAYAGVQGSEPVALILDACKNLIPYKADIQDGAALSDRFLTRGAGSVVAPLPDLAAFNLKRVYNDDRLPAHTRGVLLTCVHKVYAIGRDVYEALAAPDVNVDDFVRMIAGSIEGLRRQVPRCDGAFRKIAESVELLKTNFGGYYKDFVGSGNPTIMIENFVLDVSKDADTSPRVSAQFRRIIAHCRRAASRGASDPRLSKLFHYVDLNFKQMAGANDGADGGGEAGGADGADGGGEASESFGAAREFTSYTIDEASESFRDTIGGGGATGAATVCLEGGGDMSDELGAGGGATVCLEGREFTAHAAGGVGGAGGARPPRLRRRRRRRGRGALAPPTGPAPNRLAEELDGAEGGGGRAEDARDE